MPSSAEIEELRNLAERIRVGDHSAESILAHEFAPKIFVMAVVRTHDRDLANDLVQDTLIAVIGALRKGQLLDSEKLAGFVYGTARNLINNHFRSENQKPRMEPLPEHLAESNLIEQLEQAERGRLVHEAMEELGERDRTVLWLTLVEGRKPGEIATMLGMTPEAARTRKLRATKKVADLLKKKTSRT